jgi:hypothetical protein
VELLSKEVAKLQHLQKFVKEGGTAKSASSRHDYRQLGDFAVIAALRAYCTKC